MRFGAILLCLVSFDAIAMSAQSTEQPYIASIEPSKGNSTPGLPVTIYGNGFSPGDSVYFEGFAARETRFVNPSTLVAVTPYLFPGTARVQLRSEKGIISSSTFFKATPTAADEVITRALAQAKQKQEALALEALSRLAETHADYQVRAAARYQQSQIYLTLGDLWRWAGTPIFLDAEKAGDAVQTWWRYRLVGDLSSYLLPIGGGSDTPLKLLEKTMEKDVTGSPEPRFFRSLINARYGDVAKAKADVDSILTADPSNPSYAALAAYVAVLAGDKSKLEALPQTTNDPRAISLRGQAWYLAGDAAAAESSWTMEAQISSVEAVQSCWAGKKHLKNGQDRIASALLRECTTVLANSKEGKEARELLAGLGARSP
jgi:tetratricopeptide (TPR) repeat protein